MTHLRTEQRRRLRRSQFACPEDRKLPIHDRAHVRNAMARFSRVKSDVCHPVVAKRRILRAARRFHIDVRRFKRVRAFRRHRD